METPDSIAIPLSKPVDGKIRIPGSKSLTNRAILIASLAKGTSRLEGVLHSDDTFYITQVCRQLGIRCESHKQELTVEGCNGILNPCEKELFIGNAGTAARFLTALLTLGKENYLLNGNDRMQQRPIRDLILALNTLGARVTDITGTGCPPVKIEARGLKGGSVTIPGDKSSQYISAIMMAAPYAEREIAIHISGELVSRTYVEMTRKIMRDFGGRCTWVDPHTLEVSPAHRFTAQEYAIEGDASSASYFFGMSAITKGKIRVSGLKKDSSQGDIGLLQVLEKMGCCVTWNENEVMVEGRDLKAVEVDMNTMSDVAPTLAVVALFAEGETRINNVANMRIKECDRIAATVKELRKLGAVVKEWDSGFSIRGKGDLTGAELDTYDDHRMAMALSLAGLNTPGVIIRNPACVSKTFPGFYELFLPLIQG